MMKIGIISQLLNCEGIAGTDGLSSYFTNILKYLPQINGDCNFKLYTPKAVSHACQKENLKLKTLCVPFDRWPFYAWTQMRLPIELYKNPPDVLFSPWARIPVINPCKTIITVHDLRPLIFKDSKWESLTWRLSISAIKRAHHIIAISYFTKKQLIEFLNIKPEKITVVHNGYDKDLYKPQKETVIREIKKKYQVSGRYILYVGGLVAHKNIPRLLQSYYFLKKKSGIDHKLVLVGRVGWGGQNIKPLINKYGLDNDVILTGYVSKECLPGLFSGADVFVFPSLYEGFGIPPLEAMACGTPVVLSNAASLPEVVGDAGLCFNPYDETDIAKKIGSVLSDSCLANDLRNKGLDRVKSFSWKLTADKTLQVINKVADLQIK